ncbi:MAG TPA: DNA-processing protein DprA [Gaiellales bacterium]|nr:DNA-processing protein DprA [Gaiellales bacterium]
MSAADELRVVLAGAASGVDPGRLARRHGAPALLRATPSALERMGALPVLVDALRLARDADAAAYRRDLAARGISCVTVSEDAYPARLRELHDPPLALFTLGPGVSALAPSMRSAAIVGSRRAAEGGLRLAERLARAVAGSGGLVVSGLALGIDAAAHEGALAAGGPTIAVLGCGVDVPYPRRNRPVYRRIAESGLVVSEYPPGTPPAPWRFPARNRLIAALADVTVVVEARARSGALITADHALDLGRDVLAVPGSPGVAAAAGTNGLLKSGAGLIEGPEDLCGWLGLDAPAAPEPPDEERDSRLLAALSEGPAHPDALSQALGVGAGPVVAALTRLQMAGRVWPDGQGRWRAG